MSNQGQEYHCCCNPYCGCECHAPSQTPSTRTGKDAATELAEALREMAEKINRGGMYQGFRRDSQRLAREAIRAADMMLELALDAERYRFLRSRYFAADFNWGAHCDEPNGGESVLLFRWPYSVSASCDLTVDSACNATQEKPNE